MSDMIEKPAVIILRIRLKSGTASTFADWQAKLNGKIAGYPGFVSLEFLCPKSEDYVVVERFSTFKEAFLWKESSIYFEIKNELKALTITNGVIEEIVDEAASVGGVTEVIVAEVCSGKEQSYHEWAAKIHLEEAKFPGFRGVYIQSPKASKGKFWVTLLQFDTMENLDHWLASSKRLELLEESKSLISYLETHRVISPYAGWFASLAKGGELPAVWKQTMIVLLVLFPIVMLEFKYLLPHLSGLNVSLSTFIGNALSVVLISFPAMPIAIYFLGWWLTPKSRHDKCSIVVGTLLVIAFYLFEIAIFWSFI